MVAVHLGPRQVADHHQRIAKGLERLENRCELETGAGRGRRPLAHDHAVRDVDEAGAELRPRHGLRRVRQRRHHRIEQRERESGAHAFQDLATGDRGLRDEHRCLLYCLLTERTEITDSSTQSHRDHGEDGRYEWLALRARRIAGRRPAPFVRLCDPCGSVSMNLCPLPPPCRDVQDASPALLS